jgi:pilus assembly protein CpaF
MRFGLGKSSSPSDPEASTAASARVQRLKDSSSNRSFRVAPFHPTKAVTTPLPFAADFQAQAQAQTTPPPRPAPPPPNVDRLSSIARQIQGKLIERIDARVANELEPATLQELLRPLVMEIASEDKLLLSQADHSAILQKIVDELLGLGPLEPLLADPTIADILVNGANSVYVERAGKLEATNVKFHNNAHVQHVATRIVTRIGRRVDESTPLVDARLADGSRVNVIIPPLAVDGPMISIRKFSKKVLTLTTMAESGNMSPAMAAVMAIAVRSRLNILVSGGTGSGKTTLLNALSQMIPADERVLTIEDAAELQLQQPHVGRLETRPANLEGKGEITIRDLFKNALRMRPDRIVVGEIRGGEALDMMQAMNSGHDGSLGTMHASGPREAVTRLENIIAMSGVNVPPRTIRGQIASSIDLIVQVERMHDGKRRVTAISEVIGMEGEVIIMQDLFTYRRDSDGIGGIVKGGFVSSNLRPHFLSKAEAVHLGRELLHLMALTSDAKPG